VIRDIVMLEETLDPSGYRVERQPKQCSENSTYQAVGYSQIANEAIDD